MIFQMRRVLVWLFGIIMLMSTDVYAVQDDLKPPKALHGDIMIGFAPVKTVHTFTIDVNLHFDYGNWESAKFFFNGGILTLVKSGTGTDGFQPDRYRGTLETGARWEKPNGDLEVFVKHHSYQDIDHFDQIKESYEILGVRYKSSLPGPVNTMVSLGKYTNLGDLDYSWDFAASADTSLAECPRKNRIYYAADIHVVTENGESSTRNGFIDYGLEAGIQNRESVRYFVAYRLIHDIDRFNGETEKAFQIGTRYRW